MRRHNVTLSEPLSEMVRTQVKSGRYKDFSAALEVVLRQVCETTRFRRHQPSAES